MNSKPVLRVRRIHFNYPTGSSHRHYADNDLVMSHTVAYLSGIFPEGEDFFIRSVRHYADRITEPELKAQVKGFIGQEVTHSREHRELNTRLQQMGYPTDRTDRRFRWAMELYERRFSPLTCLAFTAAFEHYTAVIAETMLTDDRARKMLGETEVREIMLWHAFEESEHRSVAIDVYRAVGGSERRRIWAMRWATIAFLISSFLNITQSILGDRAAYHPVRLARSFAALRHSPFLSRALIKRISSYNRRGFHPDDVDNTALLAHWSTELFGESGTLSDRLR
ncbi:metal-dependent hydrolase [Nocardia uniformis]|uniref:Metal-dependent hydrolase n=1 Tax=Nocardia uniformis TaxID=53432 RepID=A0A849C4N5_9NOCA|nr:metal-dependent hydrolase [Nocardia uniformis]NNH73592.1 metal-dependent hydrolase [Nocardia uniformis]